MSFYEEPNFLPIFVPLIIGVIVITLTLMKIRFDKIQSSRGKYDTHIKDLVNTIYNEVTDEGRNLAEPNFFGKIDEFKPKILQHFSTYAKKSNVDLYDIFFKIVEARKIRGTRDKLQELTKQLREEFFKLHEKINHDIDPDFGFCSECVGKKTKFPFWNKRKLNKIKT